MRLASAVLLASLLVPPAVAQDFSPPQREQIVAILREALVRDPSILRDALIALSKDDAAQKEKVTRDVLAMVGPRLAGPDDPVAGNPLGDVTIVEFYDTRCPYCRRMPPVVAELLRTDPNIRYVMKDMPILGPSSQLESRALLAAKKQGGYFKLLDLMMQTTGTATRDSVKDLADRAGLNGAQVLHDMDDPAIKAQLQANIDIAQQLGIEGTPAFVIGHRLIGGAVEVGDLRRAVAEVRASP